MSALEQDFRDAMSRVPAPVAVVTALVDGVPQGTTVSAFASLSLTPPMVIVALDNRGAMRDHVAAAGHLGLNILAGDQADLGARFASPCDRFEGVEWELADGVPRLAGIAAFVRCDGVQFLPGGDHTVVLGTAAEAHSYKEESLSYHLRAFHSVPARLPLPSDEPR